MKKRVLLTLALIACTLCALFGFTACNGEEKKDDTREVSGIAITKAPDKTEYLVGEKFDPKGMVVEATYSDETKEAVTGYAYAPKGELKETDTKITVTFEGKTAEQTIVVKPPKEVVKVEVTKQPTKLQYFVGDTFDKSGMEVTVTYSDDTKEVITGYFVNVTTLETEGEQEIVVTYEGLVAKFKVTVVAPKLTSLQVTSQPRWTLYNIGEKFDTTGLVIVAHFENDTTKTLTEEDYTYDAEHVLTAEDTKVDFSYTVKDVTKTVSVEIKVMALTASGISIGQQPYNTEYSAGDLFNADGLIVYTVFNSDPELKRICTDWEIVDADKALTAESSAVTVKMKDSEFTEQIAITILPKYIFEAEALGFEVAEGTDTSKLAISRGMEYGNVNSISEAIPDNVNWNSVSGTGFLHAQYSDVDINAFVLNVTADAAGKGTILLRMSERGSEKTAGPIPLSKVVYMVEVNGRELSPDEHAVYEHSGTVIRNFDMQELVAVRNVDLVAGNNVIKLSFLLKTINVDYVAIRSAVNVSLTAEKESGHNWSDWLVTKVPTAKATGEMYRYCPICFSREVVTLPANLENAEVYTKGTARAATTYLAGTQEYTYDGKTFTVITEAAKGVKANNVIDLEEAVFDDDFNTKWGIPKPGIDKAVNAKGEGAYKFNVGGGGDNGGGKFTFTTYASIAATATFGIHVARNNTRCLNAAFNMRITVNGKPVCLDPTMYCGTANDDRNYTAEAYAKANEGWKTTKSNWKDWIYIVCATFDLKQGENVIVLEVLGSPFTNVDDIRLQAATELVKDADSVATDVTIKSQPTKTEYYQDAHFDPEGLVLEATMKNGQKREVKSYTYSPAGKLQLGMDKIVVEAEGKTLEIPITVLELVGAVQSLEIEKPDKLVYKEGEQFDPKGMVVNAVYEKGARELSPEEYQVSVGEVKDDYTATVTVTFKEGTSTFDITFLHRNIFEAEAFEAENTKDLRREHEGDAKTPSGMGYAARPQKTGTYTFHAYNPGTETVEAELVFSFGQKKSVADAFSKLTVNGTEVTMQNVGISVSGYTTWTETATAATVTLEPGDNTFVLTIGNSRVNMDYIALFAKAELPVTSCKDGHAFTDWLVYQQPAPGNKVLAYRYCPHCMTREELSIPYSEFTALEPTTQAATEYVRGTKTYTYKGMTLVLTDGNATGEAQTQEFQMEDFELENVGKNLYDAYGTGVDEKKNVTYVDFNNKGVKATLHFTASEKATVTLILRAGGVEKIDRYPARVLSLDVNDVRIPMLWNAKLDHWVTDDPRGEKWNAWDDVTLVEFEVEKGDNTLVLTNLGGQLARVDSIKLVSVATITAVTAE